VQSIFRYLEPLGVIHECDGQMDGLIEIHIANAALNYVARPKSALSKF